MVRLLAVSFAFLAPSALAQAPTPDALRPAFAGTVVSTYPDGRTAKLWLEPDGTYRGQGRRGKPSSGRWTLKGGSICFRQSRPLPLPITYCTAVPKAGAGGWSGKAVTGEPVRIQLLPGR